MIPSLLIVATLHALALAAIGLPRYITPSLAVLAGLYAAAVLALPL